jgi:hypothetical protein
MAKAFGLGRDRTKTATIESLANELAYLEANHAEMTVAELRARRNAALEAGTALVNKIAEQDRGDSPYAMDRDGYDRVYELVLAFDRVGY